jgi:hypothetical protein
VTVYKHFALSEVQGGSDDAALQALHALQHVPYQDAEVRAAVEALLDCGDEHLRCAAQATLRAFSDLNSG